MMLGIPLWLGVILANLIYVAYYFAKGMWLGYCKARQEHWDSLAGAAKKCEAAGWYPVRLEWTPRYLPVWPILHIANPEGQTFRLFEDNEGEVPR